MAVKETGIRNIALAGGVSANSELRKALQKAGNNNSWKVFIPEIEFTTDNAAMIAIAAYYKYLEKDFCSQDVTPYARSSFQKK